MMNIVLVLALSVVCRSSSFGKDDKLCFRKDGSGNGFAGCNYYGYYYPWCYTDNDGSYVVCHPENDKLCYRKDGSEDGFAGCDYYGYYYSWCYTDNNGRYVVCLPETNCVWNNWSDWSTCSVSCGRGTETSTRTKQEAKDGGKTCDGSSTVSKECNTLECPVDCVWNTWSRWSRCSVICGGGTQTSTRSKYEAKNGGKACRGSFTQEKRCNTHECPANCVWNNWTYWSTCSVSCGRGTKTRTRTKQEAKNGGKTCDGSSTVSKECNTLGCPVDCVWNTWSRWSRCSASCGGGTQTSTRSKYEAKHRGKACRGSSTEEQKCNTHECPA